MKIYIIKVQVLKRELIKMQKIFSDLCHFCDKQWLNNIFIASGLFGKDKFSMYDFRGSFSLSEEINYVEMKNGLFQYPSFIIYVDKVVQLLCIGNCVKSYKVYKYNVCTINRDGCKFSMMSSNAIRNSIKKCVDVYDYIQSNGIKIYYFPFAGAEQRIFFSFQQISKTEFLLENISGEFNKNSNIKTTNSKEILEMILDDCIDEEDN